MSDYTLQVLWNQKDGLDDTDTNKIISGDDFDTEFSGITAKLNEKAEAGGSTSQSFNCNAFSAVTGTVGGSGIATLGTFQKFTKHQYTEASEITFSSSQSIDITTTNVFILNVEGPTAVIALDALPSGAAGMDVTFIIKGDATAALAFETSDFNFTGAAPEISEAHQAGGLTDLLRCVCDGTSLYCNVTQDLS